MRNSYIFDGGSRRLFPKECAGNFCHVLAKEGGRYCSDCEGKREERQGYIYFFQVTGGGAIKIGFSIDHKSRLRNLRVGQFYELERIAVMAGPFCVEGAFHKLLKPHNIRHEWFKPHKPVLRAADMVNERPKDVRRMLEDAGVLGDLAPVCGVGGY